MTYSINNYLNIHAAYGPAFLAGDRLAFISNLTGAPQLWQVAAPPGATEPLWPDLLSFESDRVLNAAASPDGRLLIYSEDVGGNENSQLFLRREDGSMTNMTEGHEGAMHIFGCWLPDGAGFVFAANRRHPGRFDLFRQSIVSGPAELLFPHEQAGFLRAFDVALDNARLVFVRAAASAAHELFELDLSSGEVRRLSPDDRDALYLSAFYSADGAALYVETNLDSDFVRVLRLQLTDLSWQPVIQREWDVETLAISHDRARLAYAVNEAGASRLELYDLEGGETRVAPLPEDAPGVVAFNTATLSFAPDDCRLAFDYTSAVRTSDLFVWELAENRVMAVTRSAHGGLPPSQFVSPSLVDFPTFDEQRIPAWYYRPRTKRDERLPVVMLVHGGPESQFRPYFHFLVQYLVHAGYAVLAPNVRGSTGYGMSYSHLDDVEKRMDSVADLAHANRWLREQPNVDPDRIIIYGGSYGGFMVLSALTTYPEMWAAGIDVVGISNFVTFLENTSDYRRGHRESEYGSLARNREFLESISPNNYLDRIAAPLMVIHGANDPRVPLSEAEQLEAALQARGVPVQLLVFDDEGHGIVKLKNKRVLYPAMVAFLEGI